LNRSKIEAILFDYGGVMATEGFRRGLKSLARRFGLDPELVYRSGSEAVYESGYVIGQGSEKNFWELMSRKTDLPAYRTEFTDLILRNFHLRPDMIAAVRAAKRKGLLVALLSDQTDWLDCLEERDHFFCEFDHVFNSYYLGHGKKDPAVFELVVGKIGRKPANILFVDDHIGHVRRARLAGLEAWQFLRQDRFLRRFDRVLSSPQT